MNLVPYTAQRRRQGYIPACAVPLNPMTILKRCRHCTYFADVFETRCGFGDFRISPNSTCNQWRAR